jgi:hypothetical protein
MPKDKVLHVIVGFVISFFGGLALGPGLGFGLACLAGAAKEADDKYSGKGTVEGLDWLATCGGGLIGALIIFF